MIYYRNFETYSVFEILNKRYAVDYHRIDGYSIYNSRDPLKYFCYFYDELISTEKLAKKQPKRFKTDII